MTQLDAFNIATWCLMGLAGAVFVSLFFVTAPYGRYTRKTWGPLVSNRTGWFMMEIPASLLFALYFFLSPRRLEPVAIVFFLIWQSHYFYRAFMFPLKQSDKKMSLIVAFMGLFFNSVNTFTQGYWLYFLAPRELYTRAWFVDPRFIVGLVLFYAGYVLNRSSDAELLRLRSSSGGYKIPYGGLYTYISCPNYFCEIMEWIGWAILTWSWAGGVFAVWTFANLAPRALANHRWYKAAFPEYPATRKALVPFVL